MQRIIILPHFKKQLKPFVKKYASLKGSVIETLECFDKRQHPHIGNDLYKVRLSVKELQKGKSKSFRMMVLVIQQQEYVVPVAIYFKGDKENLSTKELNTQMEIILFELMYERE
ncbi:hypothetical protein N8083_00105 [Candidatus Pacebacteria bacterium]|nr:hypothetical protein [Candidatus Paceibacterota bacterium]